MAKSPWSLTSIIVFLWSLAGCAGGASSGGHAGSGAGSAGSTGAAGVSAGSAGSGSGGSSATGGSAGSSSAGSTGASGSGTAGSSAGGSTGTAGVGAAGTGGASGTSGATGGAGGTVSQLPDVGTDGDGDFMIGPQFTPDVASKTVAGVPVGKQIHFTMSSADSTIYPGRTGAYTRDVWLYVPQQYVPGTPAPFIVVQDGYYAVWWGNEFPHNLNTGANEPATANLPRILDNYIAQKKLPKLLALFVNSGGGDGGSSERGLEYDTVSGKFAEFIESEVLPRAVTEAQTQLSIAVAFTNDPQGRGTLGGSSGGAASFSMAWWHPDLFSRVITYSGTFVRQITPEDPMFPHGCWSYHDYDPYDAAMPNGVIVKEPTIKPIRHWLEVGTNDMGSGGGPTTYRDFQLANQRMAASYKLKNYHYHFDLAQGAGHLDGGAVAQTLPAALLYVWRGYPID